MQEQYNDESMTRNVIVLQLVLSIQVSLAASATFLT